MIPGMDVYLPSGRKLSMGILSQSKTYSGLLAGFLDREMTVRQIDRLLEKGKGLSVAGSSPHLIPPSLVTRNVVRRAETLVDERLPLVACLARFDSDELKASDSHAYSSLVVAWAFEFLLQFLKLLLIGGSPAENPGVLSVLLFLSFVELIRLSIYVFMGAVIIQAVLSWVNPYHPVAPFFAALTNPFLKPVQRAIPTIGGVDISPVFVLIFFQLLLMLPVTWLEQESARMVARALL